MCVYIYRYKNIYAYTHNLQCSLVNLLRKKGIQFCPSYCTLRHSMYLSTFIFSSDLFKNLRWQEVQIKGKTLPLSLHWMCQMWRLWLSILQWQSPSSPPHILFKYCYISDYVICITWGTKKCSCLGTRLSVGNQESVLALPKKLRWVILYLLNNGINNAICLTRSIF